MRLRRIDGEGSSLVDCLNELIEVNLELIGVYHAAITRVPVEEWKDKLSEFRAEHVLHVRDLSAAVETLFGTPIRQPGEVAQPGPESPSSLDGDTDDVHAALQHVWEAERDARRSYEWARTVDGVQVHAGIEAIVEYGLEEEAHHQAWFRGVLDTP